MVGEWHVEGGSGGGGARSGGARVWADVAETNDYFRLTEASGSRWRGTYYLDAAGRITGFMVSGVPGWKNDRGRRDAFQVWAREQRPDEAEYLMPGGSIDPTGDRPERMRALLEAWRRESGLPPVPEAMP